MDVNQLVADPIMLAVLGGHLAVVVLAWILTLAKKFSAGGFFAWLGTLASLLLAAGWFLILGGGRKNTHADQSVQLALDPNGGLWITLYIVVTLVLAAVAAWLCRRGRSRAMQRAAVPTV